MRVNVYVDGFNLYYGAVKGTPYKWLDLGELCRLLRPKDRINRIRYFTADVKPRPNDPQADIRQQTYLRALKTIPNLMIHKGRFLSNETWMRLARPIESAGGETLTRALVIKTEEKGSDVNLASWLLIDGFTLNYQSAVVISNDSDLVEPIRFVRQNLNRPCHVIHPQVQQIRALRRAATTYSQLDAEILTECQFAPTLTDSAGRTITKPTAW